MKIRILESATKDLVHGYRFYEQRDAGLGNYFLDSLFSDIDSLIVSAGIHSKHFGEHRLLAKRFPFAVYYTIQDETIIVYKDKRVNIRISEKDLNAIQSRALEEGVPYRTLMSSVLHKFINGNLKAA